MLGQLVLYGPEPVFSLLLMETEMLMQVITDAAIAAAPSYNETEIRFHIVDPIIRLLGYPGADDVYLILEEKLEYPYQHIGRRSNKDLPLGRSDYRAGVKGARGSFVIEAKAGSVAIADRAVEQAHSYAAHAQVGANYFVLCNGSVLTVHETLSGPQASPVIELPLAEVNTRFHELENILAPSNLVRNCRVEHDTKLKLAPGLGSAVRIRSGKYLLSDHNVRFMMNGQDITSLLRQNVPQIADMDRQLDMLKTIFEMRVSDGCVERGDDGKISAHVAFTGATVPNHQAMAILGINEASFATADKFLSTDPESPTICESVSDFTVSRGTMVPMFFGGAAPMEADMQGNMFIKVAMHYAGGNPRGIHGTVRSTNELSRDVTYYH